MILTPNKVYRISTAISNAQPILVRNPNKGNLLIGLQEVVGTAPAVGALDNIGNNDGELYSIADMIKCCDFLATDAEDVSVVGVQLTEI